MKRNILKAFVIGLCILFVGAIVAMLLYPQWGTIQQQQYTVNSFLNGDLAYYQAFHWYSTMIQPAEAASLASEEGFLPLEQASENRPFSDALEKAGGVLSIPSIQVHGGVVDGQSPLTMNRGFWHYPGSALPGENGKIVIIGHRYLHIPPAPDTFYNLDKVKVGAKVGLRSSLGQWQYTVTAVRIVDRHDTSVLNDTGKEQLILITCHPLWTSQRRLVIIAKPDLSNRYI